MRPSTTRRGRERSWSPTGRSGRCARACCSAAPADAPSRRSPRGDRRRTAFPTGRRRSALRRTAACPGRLPVSRRPRAPAVPPPDRGGGLLGQPHRVELIVQIVARRDGPISHLRVVRDDPVPLQRVEVVGLFVQEPLLELPDITLALFHVARPSLLDEQLVESLVVVAAVVGGLLSVDWNL